MWFGFSHIVKRLLLSVAGALTHSDEDSNLYFIQPPIACIRLRYKPSYPIIETDRTIYVKLRQTSILI